MGQGWDRDDKSTNVSSVDDQAMAEIIDGFCRSIHGRRVILMKKSEILTYQLLFRCHFHWHPRRDQST
jgi:hypothetical protein